jgi:ribosomal-protein-alanine N-acetyltransferase
VITAGPLHAAALAALHAAAFPPGEVWDAAFLASQLAQPGVLVLFDDAGGFVMARVAADEAEILTLAVHPACRRRGVGRALLEAAAREAMARGARALYLEVSEMNSAARYLYAAAGFSEVGRRPRYYTDGSSALVLRRDLSPGATATG